MGSIKYGLIVIFFAFSIVTLSVMLFSEPYLTSAHFINLRINNFINFVDKIKEETKINLILGSSELFINFSAQRLTLATKAKDPFYSLTAPDFPFEKQSRLINKLESLNVKVKIDRIIIPFSIASIGKSKQVNVFDTVLSMAEILSYEDILNIKILSFHDRLEIGLNKLLHLNRLNDFSKKLLANLNFNLASQKISGFSNIWLSSLVIESPSWNEYTFGDYNFNRHNNKYFHFLSGILQFNEDEHLKSIQYYENCCQLLSVKSPDSGIEIFLTILQKLKNLGTKVDIVYIPESPKTLSMRTIEAQQKVQNLKNQFSGIAGVRFLDLQHRVLWQPNDYLDALHLSEQGARKAEQAIADFQ